MAMAVLGPWVCFDDLGNLPWYEVPTTPPNILGYLSLVILSALYTKTELVGVGITQYASSSRITHSGRTHTAGADYPPALLCVCYLYLTPTRCGQVCVF